MAVISLIAAVVTSVIAAFFSGFPGLFPVFLFFVLLLINCGCMAANTCEEDQTSTLFMAVIYSSMTVLMCIMIVSKNLNTYLCENGLQDPDTVHPLVPAVTVLLTIGVYIWFLHRARQNRLLIQKYRGVFSRPPENSRLLRYRRMMIKEGVLNERIQDEADSDVKQ